MVPFVFDPPIFGGKCIFGIFLPKPVLKELNYLIEKMPKKMVLIWSSLT
jgi:hypothetical protein